jgi:hypothetical protein
VIVGNEEADPTVAEIISVDDEGIVLVRALPGPVEDHLHLIPDPRHRSADPLRLTDLPPGRGRHRGERRGPPSAGAEAEADACGVALTLVE